MTDAKTIKSRFYAVDYKVRRDDGTYYDAFNLHEVEYAENKDILHALIKKEIKHIENSNSRYSVVDYTISQADNDDIREYLIYDTATVHCIISDMLDINYNRYDDDEE